MLLLLPLSSVWGLLGIAFAVSNPICSNAPYKELLALSTYAPAISFCSAHFPLKACTATHLVSSTTQSTVFSTSTSTKTTITATSTVSQDSTIETTTTFTTTDPVVVDTISILTVLTTITLAARKRDHDVPVAAREPRTTAKTTSKTSSITTSTKSSSTGNPMASIWSKLESEAESIVSVACTCIETQPPCTIVTSTTFITLAPTTLSEVATVTTKIEATTTISSVITDTITTTTDVASTSDVTATTTVTVSVPFYTQVGGPYSGCEFLDDSNVEETPYTDTGELNEAITFCEAFCTADATCTFIFVQYVNSGAPGAQSFWACYYTEDADGSFHFSESDLGCNQPPEDYGEAYAFQNARTGP